MPLGLALKFIVGALAILLASSFAIKSLIGLYALESMRFGWVLTCKNNQCGHRFEYLKDGVIPPPSRLAFTDDPLSELGEFECPRCHEKHYYEGIDLDEV